MIAKIVYAKGLGVQKKKREDLAIGDIEDRLNPFNRNANATSDSDTDRQIHI